MIVLTDSFAVFAAAVDAALAGTKCIGDIIISRSALDHRQDTHTCEATVRNGQRYHSYCNWVK